MSCLENERIYENNNEKFFCLCQDDSDFYEELQLNLYTFQELWMMKEYGRDDCDALDRIFYTLWNWDAEHLVADMKGCARAYINRK